MMKSFFKKLAFVMALAMVVSLAAPAGSALAADYSLNVTVQGTKDVITEYPLAKVGDEVDFQFWKAPSNWATDYKWDVTRPGIVEVNQSGVVKALAEGTTTVTITVLGTYYGEVEVTVGEKVAEVTPVVTPEATPEVTPDVTPEVTPVVTPEVEEPLSYKVVQKNHNTVDFVFNKDVTFVENDVVLTKDFSGYLINWPIKYFSCSEDTVSITVHGEFADGEKFNVQFGDEDEGTSFVTKIGDIDEIEVTWKSTGLAKEEAGVAYAPFDKDDNEVPVILSYVLKSNGVDVTNAKKYKDGEISYAVDEEKTPYKDKVDIGEAEVGDNDVPALYFEDYTATLAVIVPSFTYENEEGEDVVKSGEPVAIVCKPVPEYGIHALVAWSIVKEGDDKITWYGANDKVGFPAFDDATKDHTLVVLVQDELGKYYAFPENFIDNFAADKCKYNGNTVLDFADIDETDDAAENYEIEFMSSNDNKLLIGAENGSLTTIGEYNTSVIVSLYDYNEDGEKYLVRYLAAPTVKITGERVVDDLKITECGVLPSRVNDNGDATGKIIVEVLDQYDELIAVDGIVIKTTFDKDDFEAKELTDITEVKDGKYEVKVDGTKYTYTKNKGKATEKTVVNASTKYTVTVKNTKIDDSFTVKVGVPEIKDNEIVVENYKASAADINQTIADSSKLGDLKKTITINEYSNDLNVGVKNDNIILVTNKMKDENGNYYLKDGEGELKINSTQAVVGDVFVVVYGPDGKAVKDNVVTGSNGKYEFVAGYATEQTIGASSAAISVMNYEATGTYTVKVYTITKTPNTGDCKFDTVATTFTVSRNNASVVLDTYDVDQTETNKNIEDLVDIAFKFKCGGNNDLSSKAVITDVRYKYNEDADRLFVYDATVYVPLDNKTDGTYYNAGTVSINKYLEVDEFDDSIPTFKK